MTIGLTDGTITTSASEQTMIDLTANEEFEFWFFLHNAQAGDTFRFRVYVKDQNAGSMRVTEDESIAGVQSSPAFYVASYITKEFKVTVQRTGGSDRAITWQSIERT